MGSESARSEDIRVENLEMPVFEIAAMPVALKFRVKYAFWEMLPRSTSVAYWVAPVVMFVIVS